MRGSCPSRWEPPRNWPMLLFVISRHTSKMDSSKGSKLCIAISPYWQLQDFNTVNLRVVGMILWRSMARSCCMNSLLTSAARNLRPTYVLDPSCLIVKFTGLDTHSCSERSRASIPLFELTFDSGHIAASVHQPNIRGATQS